MILSSLNPANGTVLRTYDTLSAEAMAAKIDDAQQAFQRYCETPLEDRAMWMKKLAGILEQEMEELATLLTMETGKTIAAARNEILNCAACCRYYAENAVALLAEEIVDFDASRCATTWEPMGVLLAVMPCSGAFWNVFQFAVPALLGGNTILLKHSSCLPQCAMEMELLLRRAGFARGVFQTLLISATDVETVLNDERVAGVAIAGAKKRAREMAAHTTWMGKKAVIQQGGANAMMVMPSANLFAAIQAGVAARCLDNGQSSASTARFIVHESVYDDFAVLFVAAMEAVKTGNPLKDETELGPLATERSVSRLRAQVLAAKAAGARVLTGGEPMLGDGHYFEPTVVVDVPHDAAIRFESVDGPVALLFKAESLEAAVAMANHPRSVNVSVWAQDQNEQRQISRGLTAAGVFLNAPVVIDPRMGATCGLSMAATELRQFMTAKTVVNTEAISGEEFNFDLTLDEFDRESAVAEMAQLMVLAEAAAEIEEFFDEDELALEADVFVASHDVKAEANDSAVPVREVPTALAPVAVLEETRLSVVEASGFAATTPIAEEELVERDEAEFAPALAATTFKEMFERALQVRV